MDKKIKIELSGIGVIECSSREVAEELRTIMLGACSRSAYMSTYCVDNDELDTAALFVDEYDQRMNWYEDICEVLQHE